MNEAPNQLILSPKAKNIANVIWTKWFQLTSRKDGVGVRGGRGNMQDEAGRKASPLKSMKFFCSVQHW